MLQAIGEGMDLLERYREKLPAVPAGDFVKLVHNGSADRRAQK
jgi:hypothetical protein